MDPDIATRLHEDPEERRSYQCAINATPTPKTRQDTAIAQRFIYLPEVVVDYNRTKGWQRRGRDRWLTGLDLAFATSGLTYKT